MREITIIVSEQVLHFALAIADRLIVIESGNILFENNRDEVDAEKISGYLSV